MRKMTLLATAFLLTFAAASGARPLATNPGTAALTAPEIGPVFPAPPTCWILVCDADGVCIAEHAYCPPGTF